MLVRVVARIDLEVLEQHAVDVLAQRVLDSRIRLQQHADPETVVIHRGDDGALFREACFLLDDGRERDDVVARHRERLQAGIPLRLPHLLEFRHQHAHGFLRRRAFGERVRIGKR
jgi:hypothetical protein